MANELTQQMIEDKIEELCEMIKNFKGSKSDAAFYACYQIVNQAAYNHFEGLGIFTEALLNWREESNRVLNEEENEKK